MSANTSRTSLYGRHLELGARMVPFAGWEMPVQYAGIQDEHRAVRSGVGVFDVSHMGEIESSGPQALEFIQRAFSNDVVKVPLGGAQYSQLCREDGGVLDDLFTYRLGEQGSPYDERWLVRIAVADASEATTCSTTPPTGS